MSVGDSGVQKNLLTRAEDFPLEGEHKDWVRDVAWAPNCGLPIETLASCSEDKTVCIYTQTAMGRGDWDCVKLAPFQSPVWSVSWSITGNVLAVASGDHEVSLWKKGMDMQWKKVSQDALQ
jgi:protein transport protein SEC13